MLFGLALQHSGEMLLFGKIDEATAILIFAVFLIAVTIGIRWFLKKTDGKADSESGNNEALR